MKYLVEKKIMDATLVDIQWERVHLHVYLKIEDHRSKEEQGEKLFFYPVDKLLGRAPGEFKVLAIEDGVYHLTMNITSCGNNDCIPSGTYAICVCDSERVLAEAETGLEMVSRLEEDSRCFLYSGRNKSYSVNFSVQEGENGLPLEMMVLAAAKTGVNPPAIAHLSRSFRVIQNLKGTWFSQKNFHRKVYWLSRVLAGKKRQKTVLFITEQNNTIASNLKAVKERMEQRDLDKDYKIITSARFAGQGGLGFKSWIDVDWKLGKSGTIFVDDHVPILDWLSLSKDTKVIQLWHAGAGFKSSGYSRWGHVGCPAPFSAHRQYTYGISGSKNIAHFFSEVWGMNDELVLPTGMPRMDEYLDEENRKKVTERLYQEYPMCQGKKVILFAPTYRGRNKVEAYYPYELIDFKALYELCGDEYVVLFKMHPWVAKSVPIPKQYLDKLADVNKYPNINELFYFTDLLITDYSSNIFEYSLMRKPMLFFAFDKVQYSFSRGFHRAYEESAPGKVCYTFEEVLEAIRKEDYEYEKVEEYVKYSFDHIDTSASDRVIDWTLLDKMPQDLRDAIETGRKRNREIRKMYFNRPGCLPPE